MTNESPVAFAAILGSLALFVWVLLHSVVGAYTATNPIVEASCPIAIECFEAANPPL